MATVVLFFPLLGGTQRSESLSRLLEEYPERRAVDSAAIVLREIDTGTAAERAIGSFLLGNDLAELGLRDLAARELRPLLDSPVLGGASFLALVRSLDEEEDDESMLHEAKRARWTNLEDEDFAEAVFRVARACMRLRRYPEARDWLKQIPERSAYFAPSRFLLAQTEYALGRVSQSLDAVESVFHVAVRDPAIGWLQDRTAIFAGEMLTEIGLYPDAIAVLAWPARSSPFRARAERAARVARALATVGSSDENKGTSADAAVLLHDRELEVLGGSPTARARIARDLERAWPSPSLRAAHRSFTAAAARRAYDRQQGFGLRRILDVAWRSFPPVILYEAVRSAKRPAAATPDVVADARYFFTPRPEVAKLLTAIAITSEKPGTSTKDGDCAARAVAARIAATLAESEPPPTRSELSDLAARLGGCDETDARRSLPALRAKLDAAIEEEVARRERALHAQRYLLEEGLVAARAERRATLQAARGETR